MIGEIRRQAALVIQLGTGGRIDSGFYVSETFVRYDFGMEGIFWRCSAAAGTAANVYQAVRFLALCEIIEH